MGWRSTEEADEAAAWTVKIRINFTKYMHRVTFDHRSGSAPFSTPSLFVSHEPQIIGSPQDGLAWTEGPVWVPDGNSWRLLFSDTVEGSLWAWAEAAEQPGGGLHRLQPFAGGCSEGDDAGNSGPGRKPHRLSVHEEILRERHGGSYCFPGQHEPGPNGMAWDPSTGFIIMAQHGARRVVRHSHSDGYAEPIDVLAASFTGLPLNCPNDVAIAPAGDGRIAFTDPYYCFLERTKLPLGDSNYTQARSALGFAGVYAVSPPAGVGRADVERPVLLTNELSRPNGIAFEPDSQPEGGGEAAAFWVSECCQGHSPMCPAGVARWHRYVRRPADHHIGPGEPTHARSRTIEWQRPGGGGGCADGFKMLARREDHTGTSLPPLIVASCPLGVCVVDTGRSDNHVVEYVPFGKYRVSNLAFDGNGSMYVTGEGHLWRLRLGAGVRVVNETLTRTVMGRAAETPFLVASGGVTA